MNAIVDKVKEEKAQSFRVVIYLNVDVNYGTKSFIELDHKRRRKWPVWGRHNIQHNGIQHNDTQHNVIQHNDTQHNDI